MGSTKTGNQLRKNCAQRVVFIALLVVAPLVSRADELDDRKNHLRQLFDLANGVKDNLGTDLVNALSKGGAQFVLLGDKADLLMGALDATKLASNPLEPEDFISRLAGSTTSEESVAWCGRTAVIGFNDSGSFVRTMFPPSPSPSGSISGNGWSMSANAGASFSDKGILLPDPIPSGSLHLDLFGDPVVGCTDAVTFYYTSLAINLTNTFPGSFTAISLSKSLDGGANFGGAAIAVQLPVFLSAFGPSDMLDKEWMAVKRVAGSDHIHITYTHFALGGAPCPPVAPPPGRASIEYVRSTDGGATFSSPIVLDQVCGPTAFLQDSHVAAGNGNDVYVAWESYPNGYQPGRQIKLSKSTDGGASFGPPVVVTDVMAVGNGFFVQGLFRDALDLQGLAVDTTGGRWHSNVYITWQDGRNLSQADPFGNINISGTGGCPVGSPPAPGYCFGDVLIARSANGGVTWSAPVRVNNDPIDLKVDQMFPAVEVDRDGQVFTVFYDRRRDNRNFLIDTFVARSPDAGRSWKNRRVTAQNFAAIHDQDVVLNSFYMGDYLGIAADRLRQGSGVIVSWGDNSLGNPNVAFARVNGEESDNE
jgi:hypothetical protein